MGPARNEEEERMAPPPSVQSLLRRRPHSSRLVGVNVIYIFFYSEPPLLLLPIRVLGAYELGLARVTHLRYLFTFLYYRLNFSPPKAALKKPSSLSLAETRAHVRRKATSGSTLTVGVTTIQFVTDESINVTVSVKSQYRKRCTTCSTA